MRAGIFLCLTLTAAAPACTPFRSKECAGIALQRPVEALWGRRFRGNGSVRGVAIDATGTIAMTGWYTGTLDLDDGPRAVIDVDGSNDMFVVKLDAQGKMLWTRHFGGARMQVGNDVASDREGNVIAAGKVRGSIDFGTGTLHADDLKSSAVVVKLDPLGHTRWAKLFQGAERAESVAVDASGDVYVATAVRGGLSVVKLDPGGQSVFDVHLGHLEGFRGNRARMVADGHGHLVVVWNHIAEGYVLLGDELSRHDYRERRTSVAKLDASGHVLWSHVLGEDSPRDVAIGARGDVVIVGDAGDDETAAGFATKLAADGGHLWTKGLGLRMWPRGVAVDARGDLVISGITSGEVDVCGRDRTGPEQITWLAKLDPNGRFVWARRVELGAWGGGEGVAIHPAGGVVVAGFGATGPLRVMETLPEQYLFLTRVRP
uniref:Uncharacterized protein n=1 Tax=Sorangium cellulosum TaxID=56 RepID=Q2UZ56_SORCE|nr:hypothetical protein [Sorangium cellulosum]